METLKVGIIGTGNICIRHGKRFRTMPETEITALVDPNPAMLKRFGQMVFEGAPMPNTYDNHKAMLEGQRLDAVLIASPHTVHYMQICDCLDAGCHVLCEKPLTCSSDDTRKVIERARARDRQVVVAYQRRFTSLYHVMKRFITAPQFGRIFTFSSYLSQDWWKSQTGKWRQDKSLSGGGQLNDSGSHIVDMMTWMLGDDPVTSVSAFIDNRGLEVDIDSAITFRTEGGTVGTLTILGSGPAGLFWEDTTITGDSGRALFLRRGELLATMGERGEVIRYESFPPDSDPTTHFVDVILGRTENASPPEDFLKVIGFTEAAWESARRGGQPVKPDG